MIVVDSSAVVAILEREDDSALYARVIQDADDLTMSAVNAHECAVVLRRRRGPEGERILWLFLTDNGVQILPFDEEQARRASEAFGKYGKGIDAKARLNLADCAAYALAKSLSAPLLFKGDDFIHTDIEVAAR
ncbi:PIN domain-containing protein [Agrobacterium vitis]|jgi:ribonuclease VapC|uniref:Ribonuclease VapC n=3 Tax=Rhizobiaceae TaxID=82115 RepID=A0A7W8UGQ0_9HYPH|nr:MULTISPECIES: type II toxin-antitoxin system VapC family toxin [Rhizobiaceae]MCF1501288.1 type II toxin-antitoxin system VapC family toxin [Allorhizobium sp. Av2]MBB5539066.1 ribonuclease VapC [Rhizobium giardinii]MCF1449391.1 type II toxin-antitoxin system VapC family toxin [Allorhizobium ampelinum]MCF1464104.1 type II toxin-antitoxin system VapC family toxin [Allorhizobium ampelinum]MCF1484906.1 type II toxin-antitoxin system VapC family toxin [Allorhizobium ampelinum]